MNAGHLQQRIELLELVEVDGNFSWQMLRPAAATIPKVNLSAQTLRSRFSAIGKTVEPIVFQIRRQPLTLDHAIRYKGQHCHLTKIADEERIFHKVEAGIVRVETCTAYLPLELDEGIDFPHGYTVDFTFPAALTEKYVRFVDENPMNTNEFSLVLVVPKAVRLKPGTIVEVLGEPYEVRIPHELGLHQNEYEVVRSFDL